MCIKDNDNISSFLSNSMAQGETVVIFYDSCALLLEGDLA
jgi:hypothetical protein